jgi:TP901 family phage tail tape measure protein
VAEETVRIRVTETGARVVKRRIGDIGTASVAASSQVNLLKRALTFIGVVEGLRRTVRTLADFGQSMSTTRAITSATADQFKVLRARARELGETTRFTASAAAEGMTNLARSGFEVDEVLGAIGGTLNLAQAGALDLATASRITAATLRGFRLEVEETAKVVDVLALAANKSNTTLGELGDAIKFVAPVAAGLGVSMEETVAAITALSDAGLPATLAGTGLRRVMAELESPSKKTAKILKSVGLTTDDVKVSSVGLTTALRRMRLAGIGAGEGLEIFGQRGGPAFEVLGSSIPKIETMNERLNEAGGTAQRIAEIMDDNLNGAMLKVKSAAEAVVLSLGELGGQSGLTQFMLRLADALRFLARNADILAGALTGLAVLAIPKVIAGLKALSALILRHPMGLFIVGLGTTIALLNRFKDDIKLSKDELATLGDVGAAAGEKLSETWGSLQAAGEQAVVEVTDLFNQLFGTELPLSLEGLLRAVAIGFDSLIGIASATGAVLATAFENPLRTVRTIFLESLNIIIRAFNAFAREISKNVRALLEHLLQIAAAIPGVGSEIADSLANLRVELPQIPEFESGFEKMGQRMGDAWKIGFQKSTQATDLVEGLFERARDIRTEKITVQNEELEREDKYNNLLRERQEAFDALLEQADRANPKLEEQRTVMDGLKGAIQEATMDAEDLGAALGGVLLGTVDQLSASIADLAVDGFQDFESFKEALSNLFRDLAKELIKLTIKFLILKAVSAAFSAAGGGGAAGGAFSSLTGAGTPTASLTGAGVPTAVLGRQAGGPVQAGRPYVVGERGPEPFIPTRSGNVVPSSQAKAPEVNLSVVNVTDPEEVTGVLNTRAGEQAVLNVISNNARQVKNLVAGGV